MPAREEMPSTLQRSSKRAQEIWAKAHDSAVETYGEGQRSHRTAYAALKHEFEKVGDHWEKKRKSGPSDRQARKSTPQSRKQRGDASGGVNVDASKEHLYETAKRMDIGGRSRMSKQELADAVQQANQRRTARSRSR